MANCLGLIILTLQERRLIICARNLFINTMVLPFMDYCDIVWGDRNNKVLMDCLQVLQNKAAQTVLDRPVQSLSTQAPIDILMILLPQFLL